MNYKEQINTRERKLYTQVPFRKEKSALRKAYCEAFNLSIPGFDHRLRMVPFSQEEKVFFEEYFTNHVTGGAELLKKVDQALKSDNQ